MDSAQHPNLHHQLILPVISPVCTPTPRLGQGSRELIDTKYRPMRVQVVGISVSYLSLPHHPCKVSVSTCISGKGKPKLIAFNPSKEQTQSSHLLYIFQSFWDPGGLPELPGFLPKSAKVLSEERRPLTLQSSCTSHSGHTFRSLATCGHRDLVSSRHKGSTA